MFRAPPSRPTSVRGSSFSTRCERSPPAIAAAVVLDPAERPQADAHEPEPEQEDRGEHGESDHDLDHQQLMEGVLRLVQGYCDDEQLTGGKGFDLDAEVGITVHRLNRDRITVGRCGGGLLGREIWLRQGCVARARPDRRPAHGSVRVDPGHVDAGIRLADRVEAAGPAAPRSLDRARDRLGRPLRRPVDPVDEERVQRRVGRDTRDDEPDRGERHEHREQARPERHGAGLYDSRSA